MIFSEIIGQDHCIDILKHTLLTGRVGSAYLFSGIEGCGKGLTARAFIASIFCASGTGCGTCPGCRRVMTGTHPDLHHVETTETVIKIERIRELQRELSLRPYEAPRKACIIDGAEKLNQSSGNALLKTLEEPPGDAILILLSNNADAVLPTIRSRCQILSFRSIPEESIRQHLLSCGFTLERATMAAARAGGSMARGLRIAEQIDTDLLTLLIERLPPLRRDDSISILRCAEELSGDREKALSLLESLEYLLREILRTRLGADEPGARSVASLPEALVNRYSVEEIFELSRIIWETRMLIMRNVNHQLAVELLLMKLAA